LYRLSQSPHSARFLLKGALLFLLWSENPHRATRDLDLLGFGNPSVRALEETFRSLCALEVVEDGLLFLAETVQAKAIREDDIYGGVRVTLVARLENARIPVQVDVGFGDAIWPEPQEVDFPTLLDFPAPRLRVYSREAVIAEKLQALVVLGLANSRMKDYLDLYVLGQQFVFDGERLGEAITATFARRDTPIPAETPEGLTEGFAQDPQKQAQWSALLRRQPNAAGRPSLAEVVAFIASFLRPVLRALSAESPLRGTWPPGGPWQTEREPPQGPETEA
jgi:predicted nucleotidyltransferase component of viral defense system